MSGTNTLCLNIVDQSKFPAEKSMNNEFNNLNSRTGLQCIEHITILKIGI
jgi:hypothetical protein